MTRSDDYPAVRADGSTHLEALLREFRGRVQRAGILFELRKRTAFVPRPEARRRKAAASLNRRAA